MPPPPSDEPSHQSETPVESAQQGAAADEDVTEATEIAPRANPNGDVFGDDPELGPKIHGFQFLAVVPEHPARRFIAVQHLSLL